MCFTVHRGVLGGDAGVRDQARGTRETEVVRHTNSFEETSACVHQELVHLGRGILPMHGGPQEGVQEEWGRHYWHGNRVHLQSDCGRLRGTKVLMGAAGVAEHTRK